MRHRRIRARPRTESVFIEFDQQHVEFVTDVAELMQLVRETYYAVLTSNPKLVVGSLTVQARHDGFSVKGTTELRVRGLGIPTLLPFVKQEIHFLFMRYRTDLLWVHAGVVARDQGALLLIGPSGQGKSTLTTRLSDLGWKFLSDDIAPIAVPKMEVLPFFQMPSRRVDSGRLLDPLGVSALKRENIRLPDSKICREPVTVSTVMFLSYERNFSVEISRNLKGTAAFELLRNSTNLVDMRETALEWASSLMTQVPAFTVKYGDSVTAAVAIDKAIARPDTPCDARLKAQ
jgi:hypothetical protein